MNMFDQTILLLERSLDYNSTRNKIISHNIANADTPNYKASDVSFKSVLDQKLKAKRTHPKHKPFSDENSKFRIIKDRSTVYNHNQNNVDIDKEMSNLAKNQIMYQGLVDRLNGKFNDIRTVIRGGN